MQLPKALPDESLFSRMCRHFAMTGLTKNQYLKRLVGDERAAVHPYLTSNLFLISKSTHETPRELWLYQTLLPLFSYYLPKYKSIIENYSANSNQLLRACQLSTFREGNVLGAKYCPSCAFVDIQHHGVAYWHCAHQIPGAEACSKHGVWLVHSELPNRVHIADNFLPFYTVQQRESNSLAIEFAKYVERKIQSIRCNDIALNVSGGYRSRLRDKGLLTKSGRVRRQVLARDQYELAKKILPLSSHLFPRSLDDFGYFSSLLAGTFNQHPFKHLLLDFYLSRLQIDNTLMRVLATPQVSGLEGRCCDLLREGLSMAQVSRDIGKSRCCVKAVALRNDIPVNLKPKKITSALMLEVIKMAYKGFHRCAIARKFGISSGSVELIISTTNGLVA
ncbi:TniQ family protein [Vibrio harveyi]|uniref:TniQ family protein n=1 Tax=Vibrio harveyi TaxID=669 RepID=UPI0003A9A14A|nr:TniQ family protein [Vibrio harveyi]UIL57768.1 TniQ family protein [Vibrio harveyi]SQA27584.1 Uncharacterised protein [Vibrio harveyi]